MVSLGRLLISVVGFVSWLPQAVAAAETGPHGGLMIKVAAYSTELVVWEHEVEVFVYDQKGDPLDPRRFSARAELSRTDAKKEVVSVKLSADKDRFRGNADLTGAVEIEAKIVLEIDRKTHEGTGRWRRDKDKARLNDSVRSGSRPLEGLRK
jgi:hypothetical protein